MSFDPRTIESIVDDHGEVLLDMDNDRVYEIHGDATFDRGEGTVQFTNRDGERVIVDLDHAVALKQHPSGEEGSF